MIAEKELDAAWKMLKDKIAHISSKVLPFVTCLLYTSDAADERSSVDLGGRRIIKKKKKTTIRASNTT